MKMLFLSLARLEAVQSRVDGIELRLDLFERVDLESIRIFLRNTPYAVLLTVRKEASGGKYLKSESEREMLIERLLGLEPAFFDLEYDMNPHFLQEAIKRYPKTKFILSYHNFQETPSDLEGIYRAMRKYAAFSYKIAAMVHSTNDALKMLLFVKNRPHLSVVCMGEKGEFARVLGPVVGSRITYASLNSKEKTAPGQLSVSELTDLYHYPSLNEKTAIYGLIGDPVEKSVGHLYHNRLFRKRGINAVYVKMGVKPEELSEFIPLATCLGVKGLSITMPLKEKILPFLDEVEPAIQQVGAVNTLLFKEGKIRGTSSDGQGALDALEKKGSVRGKKVVLLGAGGAARAIAFEAKRRGADVLILNRTLQRAKEAAADLKCQAGAIDEMPLEYDILINCLPNLMPIELEAIKPKTVAMDITYSPKETAFLKAACLRECQIVYGEEMFVNQAAEQTAFWMRG